MVLEGVGTCAIRRGVARIGSIDAERVQAEGYRATCAVQFLISLFRIPDVLDGAKYSEPRAYVLYVLTAAGAPPKWPVQKPGVPWPFILARLCAPDALITAAPHVEVGRNGFVDEKIVGQDIFGKDSREPFTVARDGSRVFAGQDPWQVEHECRVDILCVLHEADRDSRVEAPGDAEGLLKSGMLGNFYQPAEVSRSLQRTVESGTVRDDGRLVITEAGRAELRRLAEEGFERRLAPSLPLKKLPFGFGQ